MSRHLAWLRRQPCCVPGCNETSVQAHHVRNAANSGIGLKPPDSETVPLCPMHHHILHRVGRLTFQAHYRVDLDAVREFCKLASGQEMP